MSRELELTLKELVVDHVHTTLYEEDWQWQPSLTAALEGLTAAQAAWKPSPARHSIWQIVRHLILWKGGVLKAWDGDPRGHRVEHRSVEPGGGHVPEGDGIAESEDPSPVGEEPIAMAAGGGGEAGDGLTRAQALDDAALSRRIIWYKGGGTQPLAMRLVRTTTHDIYHSGQIRYLRALQGIPGSPKTGE